MFTAPDYDKLFIFKRENGDKLFTIKVNFKKIDRERNEWVENNPAPEPPNVKPNPKGVWGISLARKANALMKSKGLSRMDAEQLIADKAEPLPNPDDPAYQRELKNWEWKRYIFVEKILLTRYLVYVIKGEYFTLEHLVNHTEDLTIPYLESETLRILTEVMKTEERFLLMDHFIKTSRLTWELVLDKGDDLGLMRDGRPILRMIPKGRGESQSISGQGKVAASHYNIPPFEFDTMEIQKQAEILAIFLAMKWREYFDYQDAKEERG